MKRHEIFFNVIRFPIDICICIGAFLLARIWRENTQLIPFDVAYQTIDTMALMGFASVAALIVTVGIAMSRLYQVDSSSSKIREIMSLVRTVVIAFFVYVGVVYFANGFVYETPIPRLLLLLAFFVILLCIVLSRIVLDAIQSWCLRRGICARRNLIFVVQGELDFPIEELLGSPLYKIVGTVGDAYQDLPHLGNINDLQTLAENNQVNDVFCLTSELTYDQEKAMIRAIKNLGIKCRYLSHISDYDHQNADIQLIGDTPIVEIRSTRMTIWMRMYKRVFDFLVALLGIIVLLPFFIVQAIIIRIDSPGAPLYVSKRVGKNGRSFFLYKFRSMYADADEQKEKILRENQRRDGPLFKIDDDPRITRVGSWMRRYSVDELPNLINVLRGHMSLVGPRPHLPEEVQKYSDDERRVLTIKPGITGMAQVHGRHSNTFSREVELDTFYIEHWSPILDMKIFLKTLREMFRGR